MLKRHWESICNRLDLGNLTTNPTPVTGGLLHEMWHVTTSKGSYAIKVLNPAIMERHGARERYEATETIAKIFSEKGIPAITSITHNNHAVLELDNIFFIIYPWVQGTLLDTNSTNITYAQKIATILAQIHALNLHLPNFTQTIWNIHPRTHYKELIKKAIAHNLPSSASLQNMLGTIITWHENHQHAITQLSKNTLISHGDLDQKNVLWTNDHAPIIVDWESACLLNPTQEIISVALDWCGLRSGTINVEIFTASIDAYKTAGGIINKENIQASFDCYIGNGLNWIAYNIERSLDDDSEKKQLGIAQVQQTLDLLVYLCAHIQKLVNLL